MNTIKEPVIIDLTYNFEPLKLELFEPIPVDLNYPNGKPNIDLTRSKIPKNKISFNEWCDKTNVSLLYTPKRKRQCKELVQPKTSLDKFFSMVIGANNY